MEIEHIANQFDIQGDIASIVPYGGGHINDTYLIQCTGAGVSKYLLQKVNHHVFKDIDGLMRNISIVTTHIRKNQLKSGIEDPERRSLMLVKTKNDRLFLEKEGEFWRIFNFIEDHKVYDKAPNSEIAHESAAMFGRFLTELSDLNPNLLTDTIPDFHNIKFRFENFDKAILNDVSERVCLVKKEIKYAYSVFEIMNVIQGLGEKKVIPLRICHNDTKINNVLFDRQNKGLCVVDLDTVMPGFIHYDFGDGVRTCANTGEEDDEDLANVSYDLRMFEAFSAGYIDSVRQVITEEEISSLAHAALLFPFIMGLRFLTDYIAGDVYYKIKHEGHNLVRARAQFKLAQDGEAKLNEMQTIIRNLKSK